MRCDQRSLIFFLFLFLGSFSLFAEENITFVYVHGFGEKRFPPAFETKLKEFLEPHTFKTTVTTYRWESFEIDFSQVAHQWTEAKKNADLEAKNFAKNVLGKMEKEENPYYIIAYSLGTRVVSEAIKAVGAKLSHVKGIYYLGSALPNTYVVDGTHLPDGMKVINYYSEYFDDALKIAFFNAEGIKAGGETGFTDTTHIQNFRTSCTHVYKGGIAQRDYSDLAEPIGYLALFNLNRFIGSNTTNINLKMPVWQGKMHWNDVMILEKNSKQILFQHNVNSNHYRAVLLSKDKRKRIGWNSNLHTLLHQLTWF